MSTWTMRATGALALTCALAATAIGQDAHAGGKSQGELQAALRRLDELYRSESSIARIEMTVETKRRSRTVRMRALTRGKDRALIVIESPARDKGTATLRVEKNLWNYLPRIARTIRIPPSAMLSPWMGSDFTNDDLVRASSYADDFHATAATDAPDNEGKLVRLDAKAKTVGLWKRIDITFNGDLTLPRRAHYFDRRMRHARTLVFDQVRVVDGHRIPTRMTLTPVGKPGKRTVMRYLDIDFDAEVPPGTFSLQRLERAR
ncbi:MAG: outer membrane lipoprotein-sorting protein [Myxococcales bacterium]|nr:outer membrane lipoprotein-sorting protein [Myxococcales bacterium]